MFTVGVVALASSWFEEWLPANLWQCSAPPRVAADPMSHRSQIPAFPAIRGLRSNDHRESRTIPAGCVRPGMAGKSHCEAGPPLPAVALSATTGLYLA